MKFRTSQLLIWLITALFYGVDRVHGGELHSKTSNVANTNAPIAQAEIHPRQDPVLVLFNNAYKPLVEENEIIGRNDPLNPDKYFLELVDSAKETLEVCFFDIDDKAVVNHFIAAHRRGVKVRIVTDSDGLLDKETMSRPRKATRKLATAGIRIVPDQRSAFMHHKFMIVDGRSLWLGSMNLTTSSLYHHNNNALIVHSKPLADNFTAEFNRLFVDKLFGPSPREMPKQKISISGIEVETYFSPRSGTLDAIVRELNKAKKSIRFLAFAFTEDDLARILIEKHNAGLVVEGVFDHCLIDEYSEYDRLRKNKVRVLRDGNQALLHHKVMIIDEKTVITGSYNFSVNAESQNNEYIVILRSKPIADAFSEEFLRVVDAAENHKNLPPYDHPACSD